MIKVENMKVFNFECAIRGMRNPMNSWDKGDSECLFHALPNFTPDDKNAKRYEKWNEEFDGFNFKFGKADLALAQRLVRAGSEHSTFMRQIFVSMDITAPMYWFSEFYAYKIGTTVNITSTMHTLHKRDLTEDDFSCENLFLWLKEGEIQRDFVDTLDCLIDDINVCRQQFVETGDKKFWYVMVQMLPASFNQTSTVTMNYENVVNIIKQRSGHKLDEWNDFVKVLKDLPYIREIMEA